jgi:hypothetical protein
MSKTFIYNPYLSTLALGNPYGICFKNVIFLVKSTIFFGKRHLRRHSFGKHSIGSLIQKPGFASSISKTNILNPTIGVSEAGTENGKMKSFKDVLLGRQAGLGSSLQRVRK